MEYWPFFGKTIDQLLCYQQFIVLLVKNGKWNEKGGDQERQVLMQQRYFFTIYFKFFINLIFFLFLHLYLYLFIHSLFFSFFFFFFLSFFLFFYLNVCVVFVSESKKKLLIPKVIDDYNYNMNGVDVADQLRSYYNTQQTVRRNWMPLFFWLLDTVIVNAYRII